MGSSCKLFRVVRCALYLRIEMAINNKHYLLFLALILVVMAKTNSARTFSNRLLRLRDDNRGIGNGANRNLRRNSSNLWKVIGRSHLRRGENDAIRNGRNTEEDKLRGVIA